jgi:hypothetical protein
VPGRDGSRRYAAERWPARPTSDGSTSALARLYGGYPPYRAVRRATHPIFELTPSPASDPGRAGRGDGLALLERAARGEVRARLAASSTQRLASAAAVGGIVRRCFTPGMTAARRATLLRIAASAVPHRGAAAAAGTPGVPIGRAAAANWHSGRHRPGKRSGAGGADGVAAGVAHHRHQGEAASGRAAALVLTIPGFTSATSRRRRPARGGRP